MPVKLENYYKKPILIFAPYNVRIFQDTELHEPKKFEKTISEFFRKDVLVFSGEVLESFLLIPPPTVEVQNLISPPHSEANSSLIG